MHKLQINNNIEAEMICYKCVCSQCKKVIWLPKYEAEHISYCPKCHCVLTGYEYSNKRISKYEEMVLKTALDILQQGLYPNRSICDQCRAKRFEEDKERLKDLIESTDTFQKEAENYRKILARMYPHTNF